MTDAGRAPKPTDIPMFASENRLGIVVATEAPRD